MSLGCSRRWVGTGPFRLCWSPVLAPIAPKGTSPVDDERDLHRAIGLYIITRQRSMTGAEFRFLRKQMGFTQKELAAEIGVNEQTVANYEKNRPVPPRSECDIRLVFLLWVTPPEARAEIIKTLAEGIKKHIRKARPIMVSEPLPPDRVPNLYF